MTKRKFASYYPVCYRILFAALLTGIVIKSVGYICGIPNAKGWHWLSMCLTLLLLTCLNYGKSGIRIISGIILFFGILIIIPLLGGGQIVGFFHDYVNWLFQSGEYNTQWRLGYQLIQTIWVTMGCYGFQILTERKQLIKNLTTLILVAGLIVCMILEEEINQVGVSLIIGYILLWYVEMTRLGWRKKKVRDKKEYTLFLLPFLMVYMLILVYLPTSSQAYQWKTVRMIYGRLYDEVVTWWENVSRNGIEDFGMTTAGFSEDGRLLGDFVRKDKKLMTIHGDISLKTNLYLRGRTYDTFDGKEWYKTREENQQEYPMDTMETIYAIKRFDGKFQGNYIRTENVVVKYDFFNTGILFTPLKLVKTRYEGYDIKGRDFALAQQNGYGTEYDLTYYQMNLDTPKFMEMLEAELTEDENMWNNVVRSSGTVVQKFYTLEDLMQYRQNMQEGYFREIK